MPPGQQEPVIAHPKKDHQVNQRAEAPILQGKAERTVIFQPGKEKALG